jgi:uncharacterized protein involved in exopolysaccharide biosynthesis
LTTPDWLREPELDPVDDRDREPDVEESWERGRKRPFGRLSSRGIPEWSAVALAALGIVLISVASSLLFSALGETVYGARVDILYVAPDDSSDDSRERILATQQELLRSRVVLADVSASAGMPLSELQAALSVDVGRDDLLHVTVGDEDPDRARTLAQAIAARYLGLTSQLSPQISTGKALIQAKIDRLTAGDRPRTQSGRDRVARLRDRVLDLEVQSASRAKAELLSPAYVLDKPLSPNTVRAAALGLMIGLLLATAVAVAMLRRRFTWQG